MLLALPLEILCMVADLRTIRSMSQVCTGLYAILIPRLYKSVSFRAGSEWALNDLDIDTFFRRYWGPRTAQFLRHTRQVAVKAPVRLARFNRCMYYKTSHLPPATHGQLILGSPHEPTAHEDLMTDLSAQLGRVLTHLRPNTLHSQLAPRNLHAQRHTRSERIDILRECLQRNQTHLRIAFLLSGSDQHLSVPELTQLWRLSNEAYAPSWFSSLSSLSLSNLHFPGELLADNPPPLKRLEINSDLLHESDNRLVFMAIVEYLLSFRGLQHLHVKPTNFPLLLPGLREAILHHRSSLRSLSFHELQLIAVDEEGFVEDIRDIIKHCSLTALSLCLTPLIAHNLFVHVAARSLIQLLHIRFSGEESIHRNLRREIMSELHAKGTKASALYRIFSPFDWTATHQRRVRSGPVDVEAREFVAFSQWAFGPAGLPSLQVLAFGDFSHQGRYRQQQFLVCRRSEGRDWRARRLCCCKHDCAKGLTFEVASMDDVSLWDGLPLELTSRSILPR
ncbi:hypothetical protein BDV59DRAFT_194491 [Aspergillus ambiguus]|uniref:uncharacterized protein n=1 Tax=Aspergillus ambiguus TaxID=176160 RepID=UPI003CCCB060